MAIYRWTGALGASSTGWQDANGATTNWVNTFDNSTTITPSSGDVALFNSGSSAIVSGPGRTDQIFIDDGTSVTVSSNGLSAGNPIENTSPLALLVDTGGQLTIAPGASMSDDGVTDVIGLEGDGSLDVEASGGFATTGLIIGDSPSGQGIVTASGALLFSVNQSSPGASDGELVIGQQGTGSLRIESGTQFFSSTVIVGQNPGAVGHLDVENSTWGGASVTLGTSGVGLATVGDGSTALLIGMLIGVNGELDVFTGATVSVDSPTLEFGVLDVASGGAFVVGDVSGDPGALTVVGGLPFVGLGTVNGNVALASGGVVQATGALAGALRINGNVTGSGMLAPQMTLDVSGSIDAGVTLAFGPSIEDAPGLLVLDLPREDAGIVTGFGFGNAIDIVGYRYQLAAFAPGAASNPGTLTLSGGIDPPLSLLVAGTYAANAFLATPGAADTIVTLACFASGTRLSGPDGDVAVEALRPGDRLRSHFGGIVPVSWIGTRTLDCTRHPRPQDILPVRIVAGAFAPNVPSRDLHLSPDHAIFVDGDAEDGAPGDTEDGAPGVLVPVRYLVNGRSIRQEAVARVTYLHVELPMHDVILAEGLPCESYLDTGNRRAFENAGGALQLHPDFAREAWATLGCADLATAGPAVIRARRALLGRAAALGYEMTADPGLQAYAGGVALSACVAGRVWRIALPSGCGDVRLHSRSWVPAHMRADAADTRTLGIAICGLRLDGVPLALDDPRLSAGWHAAEGSWRWTTGDATIQVRDASALEFTVALLGDYWLEAGNGLSPANRNRKPLAV